MTTGGAARATVPRFGATIVGNSAAGRVAKHAFVVGDGYTAAFRDNRQARTSRGVLGFRGQRRVGCKSGRTGRVGRDDTVFLVAPGNTGVYDSRWIVARRAVSRWSVAIGIGDEESAPRRIGPCTRGGTCARDALRRPNEQILRAQRARAAVDAER